MSDDGRSLRGYYDAYWSAQDGWKPTDRLDEELAAWLEGLRASGRRILDVGCGDGSRYARHLMEGGVQLYGTDISPVAVAAAARHGLKAACAGLDSALPFASGSFDAAVCLEVLEHLFDPEKVAREICRVLRPGGRLLVSVPNVASWRSRAELMLLGHFGPGGSPVTSRRMPWKDPHIRFFNRRSLRAMLVAAGFTVLKQGGLDLQFLSPAPGLRHLPRFFPPLDSVTRAIGRCFPNLLAGRCVALAAKGAAPDQ
jgi:methionine biosynthesis protein MetW